MRQVIRDSYATCVFRQKKGNQSLDRLTRALLRPLARGKKTPLSSEKARMICKGNARDRESNPDNWTTQQAEIGGSALDYTEDGIHVAVA